MYFLNLEAEDERNALLRIRIEGKNFGMPQNKSIFAVYKAVPEGGGRCLPLFFDNIMKSWMGTALLKTLSNV